MMVEEKLTNWEVLATVEFRLLSIAANIATTPKRALGKCKSGNKKIMPIYIRA
jgi:hypothetical protein